MTTKQTKLTPKRDNQRTEADTPVEQAVATTKAQALDYIETKTLGGAILRTYVGKGGE